MKKLISFALMGSVGMTLVACDDTNPVVAGTVAEAPTVSAYTKPAQSGLSVVRPYPTSSDVCQLLRQNKNTAVLELEDVRLIACPKHEEGAISDRQGEGARVVGNATHWVILRLP